MERTQDAIDSLHVDVRVFCALVLVRVKAVASTCNPTWKASRVHACKVSRAVVRKSAGRCNERVRLPIALSN